MSLKTLELAFVTNLAFVKHDHQEVIREAESASNEMQQVLAGIVDML